MADNWWESADSWKQLEEKNPGFTEWANRYRQEHGAYPGGAADQRESLQEAINNRYWSEEVARTTGRPPTQQEWVTHYYRPDYEKLPVADVGQWWQQAGEIAAASERQRLADTTPQQSALYQQTIGQVLPGVANSTRAGGTGGAVSQSALAAMSPLQSEQFKRAMDAQRAWERVQPRAAAYESPGEPTTAEGLATQYPNAAPYLQWRADRREQTYPGEPMPTPGTVAAPTLAAPEAWAYRRVLGDLPGEAAATPTPPAVAAAVRQAIVPEGQPWQPTVYTSEQPGVDKVPPPAMGTSSRYRVQPTEVVAPERAITRGLTPQQAATLEAELWQRAVAEPTLGERLAPYVQAGLAGIGQTIAGGVEALTAPQRWAAGLGLQGWNAVAQGVNNLLGGRLPAWVPQTTQEVTDTVTRVLSNPSLTAEQAYGVYTLASLPAERRAFLADLAQQRINLAQLRASGLGDSAEAVQIEQRLAQMDAQNEQFMRSGAMQEYLAQPVNPNDGGDRNLNLGQAWEAGRAGVYSGQGLISLAYERMQQGEDPETVVQDLAQYQRPALEMLGQTVFDPLNLSFLDPFRLIERVSGLPVTVRARTAERIMDGWVRPIGPEFSVDDAAAMLRATNEHAPVIERIVPQYTVAARRAAIANNVDQAIRIAVADVGSQAEITNRLIGYITDTDNYLAAYRLPRSKHMLEGAAVLRAIYTDPKTAKGFGNILAGAATTAAEKGLTGADANAYVAEQLLGLVNKRLETVVPAGSATYVERAAGKVLGNRVWRGLNNVLSTAFLGWNPGFAVRNITGNSVPALIDGYSPWVSRATRNEWWQAIGAKPTEAGRGIGFTGEKSSWGQPVLRVSQAAETAQGDSIAYQASRRTWDETWPRRIDRWVQESGVGQMLTPDQLQQLRSRLAGARNTRELRQAISDFARSMPVATVDDAIRQAARAAGAAEVLDEALRSNDPQAVLAQAEQQLALWEQQPDPLAGAVPVDSAAGRALADAGVQPAAMDSMDAIAVANSIAGEQATPAQREGFYRRLFRRQREALDARDAFLDTYGEQATGARYREQTARWQQAWQADADIKGKNAALIEMGGWPQRELDAMWESAYSDVISLWGRPPDEAAPLAVPIEPNPRGPTPAASQAVTPPVDTASVRPAQERAAPEAPEVVRPDYQATPVQPSAEVLRNRVVAAPEVARAEATAEPAPQQAMARAGVSEDRSLTRRFMAGYNQGEMVFASTKQRDLYDLGALDRRYTSGTDKVAGFDRGTTLSGARRRAALEHVTSAYGLTEPEAVRMGWAVYDDVRGQMKGVADGETRRLGDNVTGGAPAPEVARAEPSLAEQAAQPAVEMASQEAQQQTQAPGPVADFFRDESGELRLRSVDDSIPTRDELARQWRDMLATMRRAFSQPPTPAQPLSPDALRMLRGEGFRNLAQAMNDTRVFAVRAGGAARDFALHNYNAKTDLDLAASIILMYPYWATRTYPKMLLRGLENPGIVAAYLRYKRMLHEANSDLEPWYRDQLRIHVPWLPEPVLFNLESMLNPVYNLTQTFERPDQQTTPLGQFTYQVDRYGFSPHWWLTTAYALDQWRRGNTSAAQAGAGYLSGLSRAIKYATGAAGVNEGRGLTLEPQNWWGWQPGDDLTANIGVGGDYYERRRVASYIGELVAGGRATPQQGREAAIHLAHGDVNDPLVKEAMGTEVERRWLPNLIGFLFGAGFKYRPASESAMAADFQELNDIYANAEGMTDEEFGDALAGYYERKPYMRYVNMGRADLDKADYSYYQDVMHSLPPGQKNAIIGNHDPEGLVQPIIDKVRAGRGVQNLTGDERLQLYVFLSGLASHYPPPDADMAAEWREVTNRWYDLQEDVNRRWPGMTDLDNAYFALTDKNARSAFYDTHPGYEEYRDWYAEQIKGDPLLQWYYGTPPRDQAVQNIWNLYNALEQGGIDRRNLRGALGEDFATYFLDKEQRNYDAISSEELFRWTAYLAAAARSLGVDMRLQRTAEAERPGAQTVAPEDLAVTSPYQMGKPDTTVQPATAVPAASGGQPATAVPVSATTDGAGGASYQPVQRGAEQPGSFQLADAATAALWREYKDLLARVDAGDADAKTALNDSRFDQFRGPSSRAWRVYYDTIVPGWRAEDAGFYEDPTIKAWMDPDTRASVSVQAAVNRMNELKSLLPLLGYGDPAEYGQARTEQDQWQEIAQSLMPRTMAYRQARLQFANEHPLWAKYYVRPNELQSLQAYAAGGWQYRESGGGGGGYSARYTRRYSGNFKVSPRKSKLSLSVPKASRSDLWYKIRNGGGSGQ